MKKIKVLIVVACMGIIGGVNAQQSDVLKTKSSKEMRAEKMEKLKAMKVEYLTSELDLTSEEAERFWPVYNEFTDKLHDLEKARRSKLKKMRQKEFLTDEEVNSMIQMNFEVDQQVLNLKREYDSIFKEVLSIQKVGKLYVAEEQFKREVMRKMKQQHKSGKSF